MLKKLPILFVCENNFYSVYTPFKKRQPVDRQIHQFVAGIGAQVALVEDGYDVEACYDVLCDMTARIRAGNGPSFVEIYTYRYREHCGPNYDNDLGYREIAEFEKWLAQDSIEQLKQSLLSDGVPSAQLEKMRFDINKEIEAAFLFAEHSAFPEAHEAISGEYALDPVEESLCIS